MSVSVCPAVRNNTGVWFVFLPVAPVTSAAAVIPALAAVTVALGLLSSVLLCHLLCFHMYLSKSCTHLFVFVFIKQLSVILGSGVRTSYSFLCCNEVCALAVWAQNDTVHVTVWNRLSTYEYIVRQRHRHNRDSRKPGSGKDVEAPSVIKVTLHPPLPPMILGVVKLNPVFSCVFDAVLCCNSFFCPVLSPLEVNYSGTLGYTNPQLDVDEPTTVAVRGETEWVKILLAPH